MDNGPPVKGKTSKKKMSKSQKRGRDAKTGKFIPVKKAERKKGTSVVETIPKKKKK